MTEWWTASQGALIGAIGGGGIGTVLGLFGALTGVLAPRGIGRAWLPACFIGVGALGIGALAAGIAAFAMHQPWHVAWPLTNIGIVLAPLGIVLFFVVRAVYRKADARRLEASALRHA